MLKPVYETVTIVIPVYNRSGLLRETLSSITRIADSGAFHVLVVDDGSTEPIAELVSEYRTDLHIDYVYQEKKGFRAAKARNSALSLAKYPLLMFVDSGMLLSSQFVSAHITAHKSISSPCIVTGYNYGFDRNNENASAINRLLQDEGHHDLFRKLRNDGRFLDPREPAFQACNDNLNNLPAPWTLMWACNLSIETDVFRILAGFNEEFVSWGGEDTELAYRAGRCGIQFVIQRNAEALHLPHPKGSGDLQMQAIENFIRATAIYSDPMLLKLKECGDLAINLPARPKEEARI